jgi:alcohol dehydrogenase
VDPTDIIVRVDTATICGTDLHILKGDVPETTPGTILGHEAVGVVLEVGSGVTRSSAPALSGWPGSSLRGSTRPARSWPSTSPTAGSMRLRGSAPT